MVKNTDGLASFRSLMGKILADSLLDTSFDGSLTKRQNLSIFSTSKFAIQYEQYCTYRLNIGRIKLFRLFGEEKFGKWPNNGKIPGNLPAICQCFIPPI